MAVRTRIDKRGSPPVAERPRSQSRWRHSSIVAASKTTAMRSGPGFRSLRCARSYGASAVSPGCRPFRACRARRAGSSHGRRWVASARQLKGTRVAQNSGHLRTRVLLATRCFPCKRTCERNRERCLLGIATCRNARSRNIGNGARKICSHRRWRSRKV